MMCSRSDYVAHLHHEKDFNYVLAEMQDILSIENDGNKSRGSSPLCASQAFANPIYHLAVHLGVSLHISVRPCIDLVSEWCQLCLRLGIMDGQVMP